MRVRLATRLVYLCARAAIALAGLLPERLAYLGAGALGQLYFAASPRRQRFALHFLRNAFPDRPERELRRLGRISTGNLFKIGVDMAIATRLLARGRLQDRLTSDPVPDVLRTGPCLGVTSHLGSWEVAALHCAVLRGRAFVVVRLFRNPLLQRWIARSREQGGLILLPRRGGIRRLAREVLRGQLGLQAVDQNQRLRGVFVPFFGELASTERAAATLAMRRQIPVVAGACIRQGNRFRFHTHWATIPLPTRTGDLEADVRELVTRITAHNERLILRHPEQYLWIHDRYRTRPPAPAPAIPHDRPA